MDLGRAVRPDSADLPPSHAGWLLIEVSLLYLLWCCSGWLISSGFYRFGTWGGILLIPVFSLPALVGEVVYRSDGFRAAPRPNDLGLALDIDTVPSAPRSASASPP